jgi:hypothetical protein
MLRASAVMRRDSIRHCEQYIVIVIEIVWASEVHLTSKTEPKPDPPTEIAGLRRSLREIL